MQEGDLDVRRSRDRGLEMMKSGENDRGRNNRCEEVSRSRDRSCWREMVD